MAKIITLCAHSAVFMCFPLFSFQPRNKSLFLQFCSSAVVVLACTELHQRTQIFCFGKKKNYFLWGLCCQQKKRTVKILGCSWLDAEFFSSSVYFYHFIFKAPSFSRFSNLAVLVVMPRDICVIVNRVQALSFSYIGCIYLLDQSNSLSSCGILHMASGLH